MTIMDWTQKAVLESGDNVLIVFDDTEMGGNANIAGMIKFAENPDASGVSSSSGGCDSGVGVLAFAGLAVMIASRKRSI